MSRLMVLWQVNVTFVDMEEIHIKTTTPWDAQTCENIWKAIKKMCMTDVDKITLRDNDENIT